jgi:hypothetical protein
MYNTEQPLCTFFITNLPDNNTTVKSYLDYEQGMSRRTNIPYGLMPSQCGDGLAQAIQSQMARFEVSHSEIDKSIGIVWPEGVSCDTLVNPIESLTNRPGYDGATFASGAWSITTFDADGTKHSCAILCLDDVTAKTLSCTLGTIVDTPLGPGMKLRSAVPDHAPAHTVVHTHQDPICAQAVSDVGHWVVESIQNDPGPEGRVRLHAEAETIVV